MIRNQIYEYDNTVLACLGDPHLGKKFKSGVPLHRVGEREEMVKTDFRDSLLDRKHIDVHVCLGDLFDKSMVDYQTIFFAVRTYQEAAQKFPERKYFIIMGNHDMSRNAERFSSFDLFQEMVKNYPNIVVVTKPLVFERFGFIPYHPFKTSVEMFEDFEKETSAETVQAVFGHWDIDSFNSEMPHNIVPIQQIQTLPECLDIFTGHIHTPEDRDIGFNVQVHVIGSMQPYSFAEDPKAEFYKTVSLEELKTVDLRLFKDKCVRVLLLDGETLPEIDCLQLIGKKVGSESEDDIDVEMAAFDMNQLMQDELTKAGVVRQSTLDFINAEYDRLKSEE